jgi:hypothetical protein
MSATRQQPLFPRPSIATKVVALLVVLALGGLATFAVFAPPTRVPQLGGSGGTQVTRTITVPASGGEPEGSDGGQRGG